MMFLATNTPVNISDIIGVIIAFLAFIYMAMRPFLERRRLKEGAGSQPFEDDFDEEEEEFVKKKPLTVRERVRPQKPIPQKKWEKDRFDFQTSIEKRHKPSAVEHRKLDNSVARRTLKELEANFEEEITEEEAYAPVKEQSSQARNLLKKTTLRNSILVAEILNEPRARRLYDGRPHGL